MCCASPSSCPCARLSPPARATQSVPTPRPHHPRPYECDDRPQKTSLCKTTPAPTVPPFLLGAMNCAPTNTIIYLRKLPHIATMPALDHRSARSPITGNLKYFPWKALIIPMSQAMNPPTHTTRLPRLKIRPASPPLTKAAAMPAKMITKNNTNKLIASSIACKV